MERWLCALLACLATLAGGCAAPRRDAPASGLAEQLAPSRIVDLSYSYGADTVYWPTDRRGFELDVVSKGLSPGGYWYEANRICTAEHGGTHMDAPVHFAKGGASADRVPVSAGIGPLVRIDVARATAADRDYRVRVADLEAWERRHGRIPAGAIVVMFSDWGHRWPDRLRYLGTAEPGDTANLHFPGFSAAAVTYLVERRDIAAVGVDTASIDYGRSRDFIVHRILTAAGKPGFENLANLDRVPPAGATMIALPMKIENGSGAPLRAIAVLPGGGEASAGRPGH